MDQLISQVTQKTGITEQQAKDAVQTVLGFLKDKLPEPIASQLEGLVSGQGTPDLSSLSNMGNIEDLGKNLGGLFGK